ncbi:hypothetical protein [Streptomyces sp. NPDC093589]|uniref:hypothetical protein n=1 Tax=Streptomyces sp. NPDC093589 TaxID=3366043 RepID=UPI003818128F
MTVTFTFDGATVHGQPTDTDGLYALRAPDGSTVLTHHSGMSIGAFTYEPHAYNAAKAIGHLADWTAPADELQLAATAIYDLHDAIVDAGGTLLRRPDGPAAHALNAR